MRKIYKNLIYTLLIGIFLLFMSTIILFVISRFLPTDPISACLCEEYNPSLDTQVYKELGFDKPLFQQFIIFISRMFSGDWGTSLSIARGTTIHTLFIDVVPRSLDLLIVPLIAGLFLGLILGYLSVKSRYSIINRLIQIISFLIFAFPIFLLAMALQFSLGYIFPIFPTSGFKTYSFPDPPLVTGFRIIDSMLSGQFALIPDYFYHLVLPWITLAIYITSFVIILVRIYLIHQLKHPTSIEHRSIVPFALIVGLGFGTIYAFLTITEVSYSFAGLELVFIQAISLHDYWVLLGVSFLIAFSFIVVTTISLLLFIFYGYIKQLILSKRSDMTLKEIEVNSI